MNILIKLMSIVSLVIAPHISEGGSSHHAAEMNTVIQSNEFDGEIISLSHFFRR